MWWPKVRFAGTHNIIEIIPSIRTASEIRVGSIKGIDLLKAADEREAMRPSGFFLKLAANDFSKIARLGNFALEPRDLELLGVLRGIGQLLDPIAQLRRVNVEVL